MDLALFGDREGFRFHVIEAPARGGANYLAQSDFIEQQREGS